MSDTIDDGALEDAHNLAERLLEESAQLRMLLLESLPFLDGSADTGPNGILLDKLVGRVQAAVQNFDI